MPASTRGRLRSSLRSSRAAARAAAAEFSCGTGAPKMHSAASPSNLLTQPPCRSTTDTTTPKNPLSTPTTSVGGNVDASAVEPSTSMNSTAASHVSPPRPTSRCKASRATSTPTCRPNRSASSCRSRNPSTILLNPACSNPISLTSSTVTLTSVRPSPTSDRAVRISASGSDTDLAAMTMPSNPTANPTATKKYVGATRPGSADRG